MASVGDAASTDFSVTLCDVAVVVEPLTDELDAVVTERSVKVNAVKPASEPRVVCLIETIGPTDPKPGR